MDMAERDALILELRAQGLPTRAIAQRVGISQTRVQQIISRAAEDDVDDDPDPWDDGYDDDEDESGVAWLGAEAEELPQPPYTCVGVERVLTGAARGDEGRLVGELRWVDRDGRSCSMLNMWRWWTYRGHEDGEYEEAARVRADVMRQVDEAEQRFNLRRRQPRRC